MALHSKGILNIYFLDEFEHDLTLFSVTGMLNVRKIIPKWLQLSAMLRLFMIQLLYNVVSQYDSLQLVQISPFFSISLWFMVDISNYLVYKPTFASLRGTTLKVRED